MNRIFICICLVFLQILSVDTVAAQQPAVKQLVNVMVSKNASARVRYGAERLITALKAHGYKTALINNVIRTPVQPGVLSISIGDGASLPEHPDAVQKKVLAKKEGFFIQSYKGGIMLTGADESGMLYGCLALCDSIKKNGVLPQNISAADAPEMVLRGTCVAMQKSAYLPGRGVYEYPYTPETFPWFYDKALWIRFLDSLVENRMNSLYLWNGHPFASLVRLKDYPFAVEVDDATFKKNEEIFSFLTKEADRRGIWVIQMFYNIIVSKPFAEHYGIKTQDRNRHIIPYIADYTRKSIAAFVQKYPNVGLMLALGEAMEGVGQDDIDWFTKTIIPGVKDGLKALGQTTEPPIVLRAHDTDAPAVMEAALPLYKNLYTEAKFNGEALTTYEPRGSWAELHRSLSRIGTVQIENVHILANLEPFRYGSAYFIQKSVQAMHNIYEANALHLYPQASYWDWPYSADKTGERLLQIDRDWIWYKEWSRYAWNCHRNREDEITYWSGLLAAKFGCNRAGGRSILEAYEESGEIAPKLLRRFGITDGNRQTLTLGMTMNQLINPYRFGLFPLLYSSESPEGEMLIDYAEKEAKGEKHIGETPVQIIKEVKAHAAAAVKALSKVSVMHNAEEFNRLKNDMACYQALAEYYASKAQAALLVLNYKYSKNIGDLDKGAEKLSESVEHFRRLAGLTQNTYLYANSMQTGQRKIPVGGDNGKNKTWTELLPVYEKELALFRKNIDSLRSNKPSTNTVVRPYQNAEVKIEGPVKGRYAVSVGQGMFTDTISVVKNYANELSGLQGIQFSKGEQIADGTTIRFTNTAAVKVLVGFFSGKDKAFAPEPELETDASANDYGQAEIKIANGLVASGFPPVNIHAYSFKAGENSLSLPKGACMILGFIRDEEKMKVYDAGLSSGVTKMELDWLFEN